MVSVFLVEVMVGEGEQIKLFTDVHFMMMMLNLSGLLQVLPMADILRL